MTCIWSGCRRERIPTTHGIDHAHCLVHEARLLREAYGPVSWTDRARTRTLPPLVVGGIDVTTARSAAGAGVPSPLALPVAAAERAAVAAPTG